MKQKFKAEAGESEFNCMLEGTEEEIKNAFKDDEKHI